MCSLIRELIFQPRRPYLVDLFVCPFFFFVGNKGIKLCFNIILKTNPPPP